MIDVSVNVGTKGLCKNESLEPPQTNGIFEIGGFFLLIPH